MTPEQRAKASERVLFVRIGWMKRYLGPAADDEKPIGGGSYTKSNIGVEAYNFQPIQGKCLGYFQPAGKSEMIKLGRIAPGFSGDALGDVLVVFVAPNPATGGQYVVGWYKHATVYGKAQPSSAEKRQKFPYFAETTVGNEVLCRNRTGLGQFQAAKVA